METNPLIREILERQLSSLSQPTQRLENGGKQTALLGQSSSSPVDSQEALEKWLATYAPEWKPCSEEIRCLGLSVASWARGSIIRRPGIPKLLVIPGVSGIGKSMLARAVKDYWSGGIDIAWERGKWPSFEKPCVMFCAWPTLAMEEPEKHSKYWSDVVKAHLLILDDVGAEVDRYKTGVTVENLRMMMEKRHYGNGYTIITTNHQPAEWAKFWDSRVEDRMYRQSHIANTDGCQPFSTLERIPSYEQGD